jgi:hypothetical protein
MRMLSSTEDASPTSSATASPARWVDLCAASTANALGTSQAHVDQRGDAVDVAALMPTTKTGAMPPLHPAATVEESTQHSALHAQSTKREQDSLFQFLNPLCVSYSMHVSSFTMAYILIVFSLLFVCGDVEMNPGPLPSLHLGHVNIRSITSIAASSDLPHTAQTADIQTHLSKFDVLSHHIHNFDYDIIGISETWLDDTTDSAVLAIEGYQPPFRRDFNRHQRGVMVFTKSSIPAKRREDLEPQGSDVICIEIHNGPYRLMVCNCYRVQYHPIEDFCDDIQKIIDTAANQFQAMYFMGDLNAKHPTFWKDDPVTTEGRTLVSLINTLGEAAYTRTN